MELVDISGNRRIAGFIDMAKELARTENADEALDSFIRTSRAVHGWGASIHAAPHGLPKGQYRILRFVDDQNQDFVPRADLPGLSHDPDVHEGGIISRIIETPDPKLVPDLNVTGDPVLGEHINEFRSMAAVPLFFRGDADDWIILLHREPGGATEDKLEEMVLGSNLIGTTVNAAQLTEDLVRANEQIEREVENIAEIQRALLPASMPDLPGVDVSAHYETFDRAGGDYYDFVRLQKNGEPPRADDPWAIIIADASGHGPAAAVVMTMVHTLLHSYHKVPASPVELIEYINANLQSNRIHYSFVTAWLGIYHPGSRLLQYACAGHDAPILMTPGEAGAMKRLDQVRGFPLGVEDQVGSSEAAVTLEKGQTLVLYTDGITEAVSPDDDMFRVEGIEQALVTCNGEPKCVILEVMDALKTHEAGVRSRDDQTIVALQFVD